LEGRSRLRPSLTHQSRTPRLVIRPTRSAMITSLSICRFCGRRHARTPHRRGHQHVCRAALTWRRSLRQPEHRESDLERWVRDTSAGFWIFGGVVRILAVVLSAVALTTRVDTMGGTHFGVL
jgi:hypothetical protein